MTKYILHGGYTKIDNELNRTFYKEFVKDVPEGGTVLFVYFASEDGDNIGARFKIQSGLLEKYGEKKNLRLVVATEENFLNEIKQADAIYLNGGSTPKLLGVLRKYDKFKESLDGKTVAGSSAGAYAIGRYSAFHDDESGGQIREGLGLLPLRVVCHFESAQLPPNPQALDALKNMAPELEMVFLKDFEWKVFKSE